MSSSGRQERRTCPDEENYMKSSLSPAKEKLEKDQTQILLLMGFELLNMEPAQGTGFDSEEKTRSACAGGGEMSVTVWPPFLCCHGLWPRLAGTGHGAGTRIREGSRPSL